jgi:hypothetical protein
MCSTPSWPTWRTIRPADEAVELIHCQGGAAPTSGIATRASDDQEERRLEWRSWSQAVAVTSRLPGNVVAVGSLGSQQRPSNRATKLQ